MDLLTHVFSELERLKAELRRRHVVRIGVFGSVARGLSRPDSDIDFLVALDDHADLFDVAGLKALLESELKRPVDVVSIGGLKPSLRDHVLREVRYAA